MSMSVRWQTVTVTNSVVTLKVPTLALVTVASHCRRTAGPATVHYLLFIYLNAYLLTQSLILLFIIWSK